MDKRFRRWFGQEIIKATYDLENEVEKKLVEENIKRFRRWSGVEWKEFIWLLVRVIFRFCYVFLKILYLCLHVLFVIVWLILTMFAIGVVIRFNILACDWDESPQVFLLNHNKTINQEWNDLLKESVHFCLDYNVFTCTSYYWMRARFFNNNPNFVATSDQMFLTILLKLYEGLRKIMVYFTLKEHLIELINSLY